MISSLSLILAVAEGLSAASLPSYSQGPPTTSPSLPGQRSSQQNACSEVSNLAAHARRANVSDTVTIPGELAYNCLQSMPFNPKNGTMFAHEITKFVQWQSTIEPLQNPPLGYLSPPSDLLSGLKLIEAMASKEEFGSQYEFDQSIVQLLSTANDGHLAVLPCTSKIFDFMVELPVVSISSDGIELPKIYTAADAKLMSSGSSNVSPIVAINGKAAAAAIEKLSIPQMLQDPDARYNEMFLSPVRSVAESFPDQGSFVTLGSAWPGRAQYEVEFANGTTVRKPVVAKVSTDFSYSSGRSLLNDVCLVAGPSDVLSPSDTSKGSPNATNPSPSYYPKPVRRDNYNLISGYYLDESNLQDVAVLAIPSFDPSEYKSEPVEFARVATEFVTQAAKDGKKKLVIDLSGNPGGQINSGMDLFKMFFPDKDIYQASRMRSHKALNLAGEALAPLNLTNVDDLKLCANSSGLCLEATVKPDQAPANVSHFESWQQIYGPYEQLGGNMTALMGVEWLDAFAEISGPIRGYGGIPQIPKKRLFEPENILLLTDGLCTSTCTIFAELMKNQGGVKSMVFGGRPQVGPMQAIGGSKGNTAAPMALIIAIMDAALEAATTKELKAQIIEAFPNPANIPFQLAGQGGEVNFKSAYRKGEDEVPLQFIYEAADYRRFYTYENVMKPETMWADAARTFWHKGGYVAGSSSLDCDSGSSASD